MGTFLLGLVVGVNLAWVFMSLRRGSNPPPPSRKSAPPAGPPEQPLVAQLIRYWAWEHEQVLRAVAGQSPTQRSNGNSKPTMPNPPAKPLPHGGRQLPRWP